MPRSRLPLAVGFVLLLVLFTAAIPLAIGEVGRQSQDFCERRPDHWRCVTPSPTPSPTPVAAIKTPEPTPRPSPRPTPDPTPSPTVAPTPAPTPAPALTPPPAQADARLTCTGYPEPRIFLESQDHWAPIPGLNTLGHVHVGMCFPLYQTVSGTVTFDVRVVMYQNNGTWIRLKGQDDASDNFYLEIPNITPPSGGEQVFWRRVSVDTTKLADGTRHLRWYADVLQDNGNTQTARANWPLEVQNGSADTDAPDSVRYMNWYKVASTNRDWGYIGPVVSSIPLAPVNTSLTLDVKCELNGSSDSPPVDRSIVNLDPDFHHGMEGTVLYSGAPLDGKLTVNTSGLAEGPHKLSLRCIQDDGNEVHEGIGVVPFVVDR